jgi:hypothetical protein
VPAREVFHAVLEIAHVAEEVFAELGCRLDSRRIRQGRAA